VVERVQGILIAEEGTIDQAEDRTGDAAGDHQVEQVVVLDLPHKGAEQRQHAGQEDQNTFEKRKD
jgi:bisphosphoglycerate-independent phosphoglycerate mutase (AlkP superfamily)